MNHANLATPKQWLNIWHGPDFCSSVVLCCLFVSHTLGTMPKVLRCYSKMICCKMGAELNNNT